MSRLGYVAGKASGNIMSRPFAAISSLLAIFLLYFLFDLIWIGSETVSGYYDNLITNIDIEVFLNDSLADSSATALQQTIGRFEGVAGVDLISRDDARARLADLMGTDLLDGLSENPLPRSLVITFKDNYLTEPRIERIKQNLQSLPGISQIFYAQHWLKKAEIGKSLAGKMIFVLGAVIMLAILLNLVHFIRLSVRSREAEWAQLRLMGAGRLFLALPYILESMIYSSAAAILSWVAIEYTRQRFSFESVTIVEPSGSAIFYFFLAVLAIGLVAGYIGSRRSA